MRTQLVTLLGVLAILAAAGPAAAQFGPPGRPNFGPGYRGNISPYLNITRFNNNNNGNNNFFSNAGINYYLGTRSEQQRRSNAAQFREEIGTLQEEDRTITSGTQSVPNTMGRYFNNTGGFFPPNGLGRR